MCDASFFVVVEFFEVYAADFTPLARDQCFMPGLAKCRRRLPLPARLKSLRGGGGAYKKLLTPGDS